MTKLIQILLAAIAVSGQANAFDVTVNPGQITIGNPVQQTPPPPQQAPANPRAWFCEVKAFMDTFDGYGATRLEATKAAQASCQGKNHEMHCKDAKCQENK